MTRGREKLARARGGVAIIVVVGLIPAIAFPAPSGNPPNAPAPANGPALGPWGVDLSAIDRAIRPGDDFFDYANGAWLNRTTIPPDKTTTGLFFDLQDRAREQVRDTIQVRSRDEAGASPGREKIAALYHAYMDEVRIDVADIRPITADLQTIAAVSTKTQVARLMGASQSGAGDSFFQLSVGLDDKDPRRYALSAEQGGISLRSRDYYLTASFAPKKEAFRRYVAEVLSMANWPEPERRATDVVALETRIAEASWSIADSQQLEKIYHRKAAVELAEFAPGFDWSAWLAGAGVAGVQTLIIRQDTAFPRIAHVFADTDLEVLKAWLAFRTVDKAAPYLSRRFSDARFGFYQRTLQGTQEQRPRWQRGVDLVNTDLGQLVGKEYAMRYFSPAAKQTMVDLVSRVKEALRARIEAVDWMAPETKRQALEKLSTLGAKLGYPDKWRDYAALRIDPDDLMGDVRRSKAFEWAYDRGRIGRPVDRRDWDEVPQDVNGYYDQKQNEIVVPAAILQPPFFDVHADMAVNFGSIGAVIGHEMTHGFDSQGRKTDSQGRLVDWWGPADDARFEERAARLGAQYDTYLVAPGAHINGRQTMSENIADLGGVLLALDAYHAWLGDRASPILDGFTGDQRVFLGWAQIEREKTRPDGLIRQITLDPHSPGRFRTIGPLRNIDAWYAAWSVEPGDKEYLAPNQRVRIW